MRSWVGAWAIIGLIIVQLCCAKSSDRGKIEMHNEIGNTIRELDPNDEDKLDALARIIMAESWKDPREVVGILHSGSKEESINAALVLMSIGDLALTPLLDSLDRDKPESLVRDMETAVSIQLDNRNRIVKMLDGMLVDKRIVQEPEPEVESEEKAPSRRVCDEVYLMMRRLFVLEEDEIELLENTDVFLDMPDEERDEEIERVKKTKKWVSLVEKAMEDYALEDEGF